MKKYPENLPPESVFVWRVKVVYLNGKVLFCIKH